MKLLITILLLMVLVVLVAGCTTSVKILESEPFIAESISSPSSPISVKLTVAAFTEPPKLGSDTDLTLDVSVHPSYNLPLPPTTAQIDLPEGITLVSGDTEWTGDLTSENPVSLNARIKFVKVGNWIVTAHAKSSFDENDWFGGTAKVCFSVSEDKILMESGECNTAVTSEMAERTTTEPPVKTEPSQGVTPEPYVPPQPIGER